jgi:TolB-like protein
MMTSQCIEPKMDFDKDVLSQLNKILQHPLFLNSDILSRFLDFIVRETLAGRENQIKEYTIALNVLKKPAGFETSNNCIVRIHAKRLRTALLSYYEQKGVSDDCIITMPKGRYVPLFEKSDYRQLSKKSGIPSLYSVFEPNMNRIAFMPLKTYDRNMAHASFVDSLGEELIRQFSNHSELSVLSNHTTRLYSPKKSEIKKLVSSYHLQYLISGSCRFEHSKVKVFVELIDAGSESQLWSGVYYQTTITANYFKAVDNLTSELISDLSKIKALKCDAVDQMMTVSEDAKSKTDILYIDNYSKNPKSLRRLASESY